MLGARRGFPREITPPHSPGMVMTGAAMLWVGWYGFNGGSALAANGNAGMAIAATHLAASAASLTWMVLEWKQHGRPSLVGFVTGTIAGLATITPASGFVGAAGGFAIGIIAGIVCYVMVALIKQKLRIDDSLDVFAVHGVGGMTGTLLTAVFALPALGGLGLAKGVGAGHQFWVQLVGVAATAAWSVALTVVLVKLISYVTRLRVSDEEETEGLDLTTHGERGYNL
jgi:Amt family ammonium transporter